MFSVILKDGLPLLFSSVCDEWCSLRILGDQEERSSSTAGKVISELSNSIDMPGLECNKNKTISLYVYPQSENYYPQFG